MDAADYDRASRAAAEALVACAGADLDLAVVSCPGWTLEDLLFHTGNAVAFWGAIAQGSDPGAVDRPERPDAGELASWFRAVLEGNLAVLAVLDPAAEAWTFTDDQTVGFIQRRIAHELAMHAWDASNAAGEGHPIDPEVAIDGIDEFFDVWLSSNPDYLEGERQSIHLHATDVAGEWLVVVGDKELTVTREHAKGDVAVRATASDLLLLLWGRVDPGDVEFFGDRAELDRFLARTAT